MRKNGKFFFKAIIVLIILFALTIFFFQYLRPKVEEKVSRIEKLKPTDGFIVKPPAGDDEKKGDK